MSEYVVDGEPQISEYGMELILNVEELRVESYTLEKPSSVHNAKCIHDEHLGNFEFITWQYTTTGGNRWFETAVWDIRPDSGNMYLYKVGGSRQIDTEAKAKQWITERLYYYVGSTG
jgi:hypothetical protein